MQISECYLSYSVGAAVARYHRLDGLNNRYLFFTVLEAVNSHDLDAS